MNKIKIFAAMFLSVLMLSVSAQKNHTKEADAQFNGENYYKAISLYKKAFAKEKDKGKKAQILFNIAECYRNIEDLKQAETWYNKAIEAKYPDPIAVLHLADVIKAQERYEDALVQYKNYKELNGSDPRAQQGIESCKLSKEWMDNPSKYLVQQEVLLNSKVEDFSPTFADKKYQSLIFTSTRAGSTGDHIDERTGENFSDLYYSKRDRKGKWAVPTKLNDAVDSEGNDGSASLNKKFNTLYFTRCIEKNNSTMGCQIYFSKKMGQNWGEPELIPIAADSIAVGHPAISPDDMFMVFASDMPGGQGGKDLWYIEYSKAQKKWVTETPKNLGPTINTPGDEMFPYIRDNGDLYFASNGHIGMGALDIFKAEKTGDKTWGKPENMQFPINSSGNDFGIIFEGDKDRGYFTSSREGGKGEDDIYAFYVPPLVYILQGTVKDVESSTPIAGAKVKLVGSDGTEVETETDDLGFYKFDTKEGTKQRYIQEETNYEIFVTAEKYLNGKGKETTVGIEESTTFVHDFGLQSIESDEIKFPEVLYDLGKYTLRPESKDSLNFLYQTLIDNPTIVIELSAHTDSRGSDESNFILSNNRAKACVDYLISKGIDPERMVPKGYGETTPIFSDEDIAKLETEEEREAAHQKNRRTVFKVLRTDFVPKESAPSEETKPEGE